MGFRLDERDGVALLTLERPPVNALDLKLLQALEAAFGQMSADPPAGLVLTGTGRAFCAGVDTRAFAGSDRAGKADVVRAITRMIGALYALPCPTAAAVNGHALGGGFVLMLACEARLAAEAPDAKLGLTEAMAGIPFPAGALEVIRSELTPDQLRRLALTSATFSPTEMVFHGVMDEVVPGDLVAAATARVRSLAAQPAFGAVKRQVRAAAVARLQALAASGEDPMIAGLV